MNTDFVEKNLIYMVVSGSHLYGTATELSDIDKRGVCVPPRNVVMGFANRFEQKNYTGEDTTVYSLMRFIELASDCNPNIIELLFAPKEAAVVWTDLWEELVKHRQKFVSANAYHRFSGYAFAQLKKIKSHKGWLLNPPSHKPTREEFGLTESSLGLRELSTGVDAYEIDPQVVKVIQQEKNYKSALTRWNQYEEWKKNRNPARAELEAKHGFDCYSSDTEFLTEKGWKNFDSITSDDLLATVFINETDLSTAHRRHLGVEYQKYTYKFDSLYTGPMLELSGYHVDVSVTANHRMLIRKKERASEKIYDWKLEEAARLPDTFEVIIAPSPLKNISEYPEVLTYTPLNPIQLLRLMGWFLSDGTINVKEDIPTSVRISQKKDGKLSWDLSRFYGEVKDKIRISEYEYLRSPNEFNSKEMIETVLSISEPSIVDFIVKECGRTVNKRIPRWVFKLSKRCMTTLLDAALKGDGTIRNTSLKSSIYYSSLVTLADDIQELALLCGFETSRYGPYTENYTYKGEPRQSTMYQVHINKDVTQTRTMVRCNNLKEKMVTNHRVVCFTVPNGTLITRRNGHVAVHGNCKHGSHLVRLLRMGKEILTTGEVHVKRPDAAELLAIKNGKWTFEQLMEYVEPLMKELDDIYENKKYVIPYSVNKQELSDLAVELHEKYWRWTGEWNL